MNHDVYKNSHVGPEVAESPLLEAMDGDIDSYPESAITLGGIGLVRRDLGELPESLSFDFSCETHIMQHTGSRPWCILSEIQGDWSVVLDSIPSEYKVHMLELRVDESNLTRNLAEVIKMVGKDLERHRDSLGEVSLIAVNNSVTIIAHAHLEPFWAKAITTSIDEYLAGAC